MNYIFHLTRRCNLNCKYCYENKGIEDLSFESIKLVIDSEIKAKNKISTISFYGGEPLIRKDLIYQTVDYIKSQKSKTKFFFNMTTNGTLLDEEFIAFAKKNEFLHIAYSFDGIKEVHDLNRITVNRSRNF